MKNLLPSFIVSNPFDGYPRGGRVCLGRLVIDNCRHGCGLRLYQTTKLSTCAYCGIDFQSAFVCWMMMSVDHVVPIKVAETWNIPREWYLDMINCVLCCRACNELDNRNELKALSRPRPQTFEEFLALRDEAFQHRFHKIAQRRKEEQAFYQSIWKGSV